MDERNMTLNNSSLNSDHKGTKSSDNSFMLIIAMYCVLLVIGTVGNGVVLATLLRDRVRSRVATHSRVKVLMTHLVIADLLVVLFTIPTEIAWRITNAWYAGNFGCKFVQIFRAFGLYLSSNVLICISVDRYFSIKNPLRLPTTAMKRCKMMLISAWVVAAICSSPQCYVFNLMENKREPGFLQCVTFGTLDTPTKFAAYNIFSIIFVFIAPLLIISVCYLVIFYEISKSNNRSEMLQTNQRPSVRRLKKTFRMTLTIVIVFGCCWLPYFIMTLWYIIDEKSAKQSVSRLVQDLLFMMAVSNSCVDPLVYGSYTMDPRMFTLALRKVFCVHRKQNASQVSRQETLTLDEFRTQQVSIKSRIVTNGNKEVINGTTTTKTNSDSSPNSPENSSNNLETIPTPADNNASKLKL